MTDYANTRRAFLAAGGAVAGSGVVSTASAQQSLTINDPAVAAYLHKDLHNRFLPQVPQ